MRYLLSLALMIGGGRAFAGETVPHGWVKAGSFPAGYAVSVQPSGMYKNHSGIVLKSTETLPLSISNETEDSYKNRLDMTLHSKKVESAPFATLMQDLLAQNYRRRRIRLSGYLRVYDTPGKATLWMRIDGPGGQVLGFDNLMKKQALSGNSAWKREAIVMDVPPEAGEISFGILLSGSGLLKASDLKFQIVGKNVPVSVTTKNVSTPKSPVNLDFK